MKWKGNLFRIFLIVLLFFTFPYPEIGANPTANRSEIQSIGASRFSQEPISFFPFHFPMEVTFSPGYKPIVPSLGTQIVFPGTVKGLQIFLGSSPESPMNIYYDPAPSLSVDPILRNRSRLDSPNLFLNRNPGVVFLVNRNQFSFFMDLNLRMALDLSGQAASQILRTGVGVQYRIPSEYLASRQLHAAVDVSLQAIEFQPWEEKRRSDRIINRQFYLSPGITIGSNRGWMVEGLIRMPLPTTVQEAMESAYRPEVQGRLGIKWYLPDTLKP